MPSIPTSFPSSQPTIDCPEYCLYKPTFVPTSVPSIDWDPCEEVDDDYISGMDSEGAQIMGAGVGAGIGAMIGLLLVFFMFWCWMSRRTNDERRKRSLTARTRERAGTSSTDGHDSSSRSSGSSDGLPPSKPVFMPVSRRADLERGPGMTLEEEDRWQGIREAIEGSAPILQYNHLLRSPETLARATSVELEGIAQAMGLPWQLLMGSQLRDSIIRKQMKEEHDGAVIALDGDGDGLEMTGVRSPLSGGAKGLGQSWGHRSRNAPVESPEDVPDYDEKESTHIVHTHKPARGKERRQRRKKSVGRRTEE